MTVACAQNHSQNTTPTPPRPAPPAPAASAPPVTADAACPRSAQELPPGALHGRWRVQLAPQREAIATLGPHPDYPGVRGSLARGSAVHQLAGDINDEGALALDESEDGRSISASWALQLQPESCGKEFKGTWQHVGDKQPSTLVMTRIAPTP